LIRTMDAARGCASEEERSHDYNFVVEVQGVQGLISEGIEEITKLARGFRARNGLNEDAGGVEVQWRFKLKTR
jgi:hypothetical protein